MQVRLDQDIAEYIQRQARAYRRIFKRKKSAASYVNEMLRPLINHHERPAVHSP